MKPKRFALKGALISLLVGIALSLTYGIAQATDDGLPSAPQNIQVTHTDSALSSDMGSIVVTWDAPADEGASPIADYVVQIFDLTQYVFLPMQGSCETDSYSWYSLSRTCTVLNLSRNTDYQVFIYARHDNSAEGQLGFSSVFQAQVKPGVVDQITVTPGAVEVNVAWEPPTDNGGSPIVGYRVFVGATSLAAWDWASECPPTAIDCFASEVIPGDQLAFQVRGLRELTSYYVSVVATNAVGTSIAPVSLVATSTKSRFPPISGLTVTPTRAETVLTWSFPSFAMYAEPAEIRIRYSDSQNHIYDQPIPYDQCADGTINPRTENTCSITSGLTWGETYWFTVAIVDVEGYEVVSTSVPGLIADRPGIPENIAITHNDNALASDVGSVVVSWDPPSDNGSSPLTKYELSVFDNTHMTYFSANGSCADINESTESLETSCNIANLGRNADYIIFLQAVNIVGKSSPAMSSTFHAQVKPGVVDQISTSAGATQLDVSWLPPTDTGDATLTAYRVFVGSSSLPAWNWASECDPGATDCFASEYLPADQLDYRVTGLRELSTYYVAVVATNSIGTSVAPVSMVAFTTRSGLDPVSNLQAERSELGATLTWSLPNFDYTIPPTGLEVLVSATEGGTYVALGTDACSEGALIPDQSTSCTVTSGLTAGETYWFKVALSDGEGITELSSAVSVVAGAPSTFPSEPLNVAIRHFDGAISHDRGAVEVSWDSPIDDGGSSITGYEMFIYYRDALVALPVTNGTCVDLTDPAIMQSRSCTITDVSRPGDFNVVVMAVNEVGQGEQGWSETFRGLGRPSEPTAIAIEHVDGADSVDQGAINISWEPPTDDGGVSILSYTLRLYNVDSDSYATPSAGTCESFSNFNGLINRACAITNLERFTNFKIAIESVNEYGESVTGFSETFQAQVKPGAIDAPELVRAFASSLEISWNAPADDGGSDITNYHVYMYPSAMPLSNLGNCIQNSEDLTNAPCVFDSVPAGLTTLRLFGLSPNSEYSFYIAPVNAIGASRASPVVSSASTISHAEVSSLSATSVLSGINLSWQVQDLAARNGIISYYVKYSTSANGEYVALPDDQCVGNSFDREATNLSCSITTGIDRGQTYWLKVSALDTEGFTSESTASARFMNYATEPTSVSIRHFDGAISPDRGAVEVTWAPPIDDGGSGLIGYQMFIYYQDALVALPVEHGSCVDVAEPVFLQSRSCTITDMPRLGEYSVVVMAFNEVGLGAQGWSETFHGLVKPSVIGNLTVEARAVTSTVSWSAPVDDGGSAVSGYRIVLRNTVTSEEVVAQGTCANGVLNTSIDTTCVLQGLEGGATYSVDVVALNAIGASISVDTLPTFTTLVATDAISDVVLNEMSESVAVSWNPIETPGALPVIDYDVMYRESGDPDFISAGESCTAVSALAPACLLTGLINGTEYEFVVRANDEYGDYTSSPVFTATPWALPGVPRNVDVNGTRGELTITWDAPTSSGGFPIAEYVVMSSRNQESGPFGNTDCIVDVAVRECSLENLVLGDTYYFQIAAVTSKGTGLFAPVASGVTNAESPSVPRSVSATVSDLGVASVSWNLPADTGLAPSATNPISAYEVTASPSTGLTIGSVNVSTRSVQVSGLSKGVAYTFTVKVTNSAGLQSSASAPSSAVTWRTSPDAPRTVTGVRGNGSVVVSWLAPLSNGGSGLTKYTAQALAGGTAVAGKTCTTPTVTPPTLPALTCTITGLTNGTSYTFTVKSFTGTGESTTSTASAVVIPATKPSAPSKVVLKSTAAGIAQWTITLGSTGGSAITSTKFRTSLDNKKWSAWVTVKTGAKTKGWKKSKKTYVQVQSFNALGAGATKALTFTPTK